MICKNKESLLKDLKVKHIEEVERFPKFFEIETINACNARCIMCTVNEWNQKKSDDFTMSMELFEKFVDEVKCYKDWIDTICLNRDGEPTLDRYLVKRVKLLKEANIKKVTFSTNAQLLTSELSQELLDSRLDDIMISVDSIHKETFEEIRVKLSFEKVLANVLEFIRLRDAGNYKTTIRIRAIKLEKNQDELDEWLKFWNDKIGKIDRAYIMPEHSWGNQSYEEQEAKKQFYSNIACISPFSTMVMHVDGTIGLCGCDYKAFYKLGDFKIMSLQEIWQGEKYKQVRFNHYNKKRNEIPLCQGCDIWDREYREIK
jgi:molybdenum cofactor biosynthesis enzyme MoaA